MGNKFNSVEEVYSYALEAYQIDLSEIDIASDIVDRTKAIASLICDLCEPKQEEPLTHKVVGDAMFQIIEQMNILQVTLNHWDSRESAEATKLEKGENG